MYQIFGYRLASLVETDRLTDDVFSPTDDVSLLQPGVALGRDGEGVGRLRPGGAPLQLTRRRRGQQRCLLITGGGRSAVYS